MPGKQRLGVYEEQRPTCPRQDPRQRRQQRSIGYVQLGPAHLTRENRDLMAQHEDLDLLGLAPAEEQRHQLQHAPQRHIHERETNSCERSGAMAAGRYSTRAHGTEAARSGFRHPQGHIEPSLERPIACRDALEQIALIEIEEHCLTRDRYGARRACVHSVAQFTV